MVDVCGCVVAQFGSHQLFHFLVVAAAVQHYGTVTTLYNWRVEHLCPAATPLS